jgi:hypothetical protein
MAAVLKTANGESRSWVQIPPLPPVILHTAAILSQPPRRSAVQAFLPVFFLEKKIDGARNTGKNACGTVASSIGKCVCHAKFRLRRSKRSDTFMLAVRND